MIQLAKLFYVAFKGLLGFFMFSMIDDSIPLNPMSELF